MEIPKTWQLRQWRNPLAPEWSTQIFKMSRFSQRSRVTSFCGYAAAYGRWRVDIGDMLRGSHHICLLIFHLFFFSNIIDATRVPLTAQPWNPGSDEVETQGGNGRKWESERGREREGEREREKCCFCLQNDLKEPYKCKNCKCIPCLSKSLDTAFIAIIKKVEHTL